MIRQPPANAKTAPESASGAGSVASAPPENSASASKPTVSACLNKFASKRLLALLLAVSVFGHAAGIAAYMSKGKSTPPKPAPSEPELGLYCFVPEAGDGAPVLGATFRVHAALIDEVAPLARRSLAEKEFRVRQGIEELLRRAHPGDFRDPALTDLKRQMKDQVNEVLGMRAVSDIIITDLGIDRPARTASHPADVTGTPPHAPGESPSG